MIGWIHQKFVPATLLETSTGFGKAWLVDVLIAMDLWWPLLKESALLRDDDRDEDE